MLSSTYSPCGPFLQEDQGGHQNPCHPETAQKQMLSSVIHLGRATFQKQATDGGVSDQAVCDLPWVPTLLAFLERHRLHYDPEVQADIMVKSKLQNINSVFLTGFKEQRECSTIFLIRFWFNKHDFMNVHNTLRQ